MTTGSRNYQANPPNIWMYLMSENNSLEDAVPAEQTEVVPGQETQEDVTLGEIGDDSANPENESDEHEDESAEDDAEEEQVKKPAKGFKRRVQKLSNERDYWRDLALQQRAGQSQDPTPQEPVAQPEVKPMRYQFASDDDFMEALTEWKIDQRFTKQQTVSKQQQLMESYGAKVQSFAKEVPDFQERLAEVSHIPVPDDMVELIMESDLGPAISLHLADDPDEFVRLTRLSVAQRAKAIGRIEAAIEAKAPAKKVPALEKKKVSTAPAPITSVKGAAPVQKTIYDEDLSYNEWEKLRNKRK